MAWRTFLLVLLVARLPVAAGETVKPIATSLCDVLRSPADYDGKIVRVRGTVVAGFEIFAVRDPVSADCRVSLEYAGAGPVASTSLGALTPRIDRPAIELRRNVDLSRFQHALTAEMYPRNRDVGCSPCLRYEVTASLTGRIDAAVEPQGFGHMNMFPVQLVLASVADVSARDLSSEYDPDDYSPRPVRFPTGYLSGRLLDPDGKPVYGAYIDTVSTDEVPPDLDESDDWTDEKGRFSLAVPPGTYIIGVNTKKPPSAEFPFAATWHPSAPDSTSARRITVRDRQRIRGLDIRLRRNLDSQSVPVRVVWPDGTPVANANVWLSEAARPTYVVGDAVSHTREDGSFELPAFSGTAYLVRANIYLKPSFRPHCAEPQRLDAIPTAALTLVLTRTDEGCRSGG